MKHRTLTTVDPPPPKAALPVPEIHAGHVFTLDTLREALSLRKGTLAREIRLRRLRASKRAGRIFVLGSWVLEWLHAGELRRDRGLDGNGQAPS